MHKSKLSEMKKQQMISVYQEWFDEHQFVVHWATLEFIKFHWKVDATIQTDEGKKTHTFFMTPDSLMMFDGIGKPFIIVKRLTESYELTVFDKMRDAIKKDVS